MSATRFFCTGCDALRICIEFHCRNGRCPSHLEGDRQRKPLPVFNPRVYWPFYRQRYYDTSVTRSISSTSQPIKQRITNRRFQSVNRTKFNHRQQNLGINSKCLHYCRTCRSSRYNLRLTVTIWAVWWWWWCWWWPTSGWHCRSSVLNPDSEMRETIFATVITIYRCREKTETRRRCCSLPCFNTVTHTLFYFYLSP